MADRIKKYIFASVIREKGSGIIGKCRNSFLFMGVELNFINNNEALKEENYYGVYVRRRLSEAGS